MQVLNANDKAREARARFASNNNKLRLLMTEVTQTYLGLGLGMPARDPGQGHRCMWSTFSRCTALA